ncbi:MAG: AAA family ATPase [Rhodospirillaceae bacterium]|nr:AAA family ATPase [Rhodospirillaceae bacterium]MBT5780169.1 AAA family ATPase [Rhodospirillaceae bacterium]
MARQNPKGTAPAPLSADQLCRFCDPGQFPFTTTAELDGQTEIAGQDRAVEAIRFALGIKQEGYNVFVLGPSGSGKHAIARRLLKHQAGLNKTPSDWCYVYNFKRRHKPHALELPAGEGARLRDTVNKLIEDLKIAIPAIFESDEYRNQRKAAGEEVKQRQDDAFAQIQKEANAVNIAIMQTENGIAFAPTENGEMLPPEKLNAMTQAEREAIQKNVGELQKRLHDTMMMVPQWAREAREKFLALDRGVTSVAVKSLMDDTKAQFKDLPRVVEYLLAVEQDVIDNVNLFRGPMEAVNPAQMMPPGAQQAAPARPDAGDAGAPFRRYRVNLFVDRSHLKGSPVIYADHPTYQELIGSIEHVAEMGTLTTDFTRIKSGALHRANGGYLMLDARKVLMEPFAWEGLKRALRSREIRVEHPAQTAGVISTQTLSPEPVPLDVKVVLIGERQLYYLLDQRDPDFAELFKVTGDFEDKIERNDENNMTYARLLGALAQRDGLHPLTSAAVARLCDYSARLAADAERLSTQMRRVSDLVREADYFATEQGCDTIDTAHVEQAIEGALGRVSRIRESMQEQILRGSVLIDTEGATVGQINGLAVLQTGRFSFGKPSRITVRLRVGTGKVIDIEREVELGGPLHSKGVLILSSYLATRYATDRPLSLSASIVFEQSYGGVDGDSASSTELYALLSSLAEVPIQQNLAVTGAVNQNGEVQAIGGANEKIEGFFDVCSARGLNGKQGVLIPQSNVKNLMLRRDVLAAVGDGQFHIYAVATIDEGIEILTGVAAGTRDTNGAFPAESINGMVEARLHKLADQRRAFARSGKNDNAEDAKDA